MGKRRNARELALKMLFPMDVGKMSWEEVMQYTLDERKVSQEVKDFALDLVRGTLDNLKEIDKRIRGLAVGWTLERMVSTDRNILRLAIYEILFREDIPWRVSIDEAVELSKKYGTEDSGKFVNGILGNLVRSLDLTQ